MRMGGKSAPFGVDEESMDVVVDALAASSRIEVSGVHIFAGTQILDADVLEAQYRKCLEIADRLATKLGRPLSTVDFGGGLGIPYFDGDVELDVNRYGQLVDALVRDLESDTRLMVEPGRYLVGEAGLYVTRVVDVKESRGKRFVVVDGGMNHHLGVRKSRASDQAKLSAGCSESYGRGWLVECGCGWSVVYTARRSREKRIVAGSRGRGSHWGFSIGRVRACGEPVGISEPRHATRSPRFRRRGSVG